MTTLDLDALIRSFATAGTRRRLACLLAAVPLGGLLAAREGARAEIPHHRLQQRTTQRNRKQRNARRRQQNDGPSPGGTGQPALGQGSACNEECLTDCIKDDLACGQSCTTTCLLRCEPGSDDTIEQCYQCFADCGQNCANNLTSCFGQCETD
jgi:hypothetical protein